MPYEEAVYVNDCLVNAVTADTARRMVRDALLSQDFEVLEYLRCEIFQEGSTEPIYEKRKSPGGEVIAVDTMSNHIDEFFKTGKLTFGNFIFPEDRML